MMTTGISILDLQVRALQAKTACPRGINGRIRGGGDCPDCRGTGRVLILDPENTFGLRVEAHTTLIGLKTYECDWGASCSVCQGRGWMPNPDGFAWIRAARAMDWQPHISAVKAKNYPSQGYYVRFLVMGKSFDNLSDDLDCAFYTATAQAVAAQAKEGESSD